MSITFNQFLIEELIKRLGKYLITSDDLSSWFQIEKVTYGDVLAHSKRILLVTRPSLWEGSKFDEATCSKVGIHDQSKYITSTWHDCGEPTRLFENHTAELNLRDKDVIFRFKFHCSQMILTLQGSVGFVLQNLITGTVPSIFSVNKKLHDKKRIQQFIFWLLKNNRGNIFMLDFIEYDFNLLLMIISANGNKHLTIAKLMIGNISKLDHVNNYVIGDTMLYIPKVKYFINQFKMKGNDILVAYGYQNRPYQVKTFASRDSCLIYNNPFLEQEEKAVYSYFVFIKSGKFSIVEASDKTTFEKTNVELTTQNIMKQGFWIPGHPDF